MGILNLMTIHWIYCFIRKIFSANNQVENIYWNHQI